MTTGPSAPVKALPKELIDLRESAKAALAAYQATQAQAAAQALETSRLDLLACVRAAIPAALHEAAGLADDWRPSGLTAASYALELAMTFAGHAPIGLSVHRDGNGQWFHERLARQSSDPLSPDAPPMWAVYLPTGQAAVATLGMALALAEWDGATKANEIDDIPF